MKQIVFALIAFALIFGCIGASSDKYLIIDNADANDVNLALRNLEDLNNVANIFPSNLQYLRWNGTTGYWEPAPGSAVGIDTNWETSWAIFDVNMKSYFLLQDDGNAFYVLKEDVNIWTEQLLGPYLLKVDANGFYTLKSDSNIWSTQLILSSQEDSNQWALTKTDGNALYPFIDDVNVWIGQLDTNIWTAGVINNNNVWQDLLEIDGNVKIDGNHLIVKDGTAYDIHDLNYHFQGLYHFELLDMPSADNNDHDGRYYTEAELGAYIYHNSEPTGASLIGFSSDAKSLYTTVEQIINLITSVGHISGGIITHDNNRYIDISGGTGFIRDIEDLDSILFNADWNLFDNYYIDSNIQRHLGLTYDSNYYSLLERNEDNFNGINEFGLGSVIFSEGEMYVFNNPSTVLNPINRIIKRIEADGYIVRDSYVGGLVTSVTGTRNVVFSSGRVWSKLNKFDINGIDTTTGDTFEYYWYNGVAGVWTRSDATQYSSVLWNDTTLATLQTIPNKKYANLWVYYELDDLEVAILYPQAHWNSVGKAEDESPPNLIPDHISAHGILVGRIIIEEGVDAPTKIETAWGRQFTPSLVIDHGNLAGLGDDDHTQYLLANGSRGMTGDLNMQNNDIVDVNVLDVNRLLVGGTDFSAIEDTNAETACGAGEVLYGDGSCAPPLAADSNFGAWERILATSVSTSDDKIMDVNCTATKNVLGGGCYINNIDSGINIQNSYPFDNNTWRCGAIESDPVSDTWTVTVYVICADT